MAPNGKIRATTFNCPGSWHDSTMSEYGVYRKMEEMYNLHGAKVAVDSAAFSMLGKPYLVRSLQMDLDLQAADPSAAILLN